jgi:hypothetical protein
MIGLDQKPKPDLKPKAHPSECTVAKYMSIVDRIPRMANAKVQISADYFTILHVSTGRRTTSKVEGATWEPNVHFPIDQT